MASIDDPGLSIELTMDLRGHIKGRYNFTSERRDGEPTVLSGEFDMDQSFLASLEAEIDALVSKLRHP